MSAVMKYFLRGPKSRLFRKRPCDSILAPVRRAVENTELTPPIQAFEKLVQTDPGARDGAWERAFLAALPQARVKTLSPEAKAGPDGWPYLFVATDDGPDSEPLVSVLHWLSSRGIGLAINPQKEAPDFVLTYGMVWNFRERGQFLSEMPVETRSGAIEVTAGQEVLTAQPSEHYLPPYVRSILKQFLADQGIFAPKILMVSFDKQNYDLCFSSESFKSPSPADQGAYAEALGWFLPAHYVVSMISEKALPGFQPL